MQGVFFHPKKRFEDDRGWLLELFRTDELEAEHHPLMAYVSETLPGIMRGPHEHLQQTDYFMFVGPGEFELYLWDRRKTSDINIKNPDEIHLVGSSNPMGVIVPPGIAHAYKNVSDVPGIVYNAPNRLYCGPGKKYPCDEIRHEDA